MHIHKRGTDAKVTRTKVPASDLNNSAIPARGIDVYIYGYSTVRYGMVQYGMVRYGTVWYGTVRYSTVRYGTVQYGTVRYGTVQYGMVRYRSLGSQRPEN